MLPLLTLSHYFCLQADGDLTTLQTQIIQDRKLNRGQNIATVVFSPDVPVEGASEAALVAAVEGKYDALRDRLLLEALKNKVRILSDQSAHANAYCFFCTVYSNPFLIPIRVAQEQ
jgi:hypothetical protein